MPNKQVPRPKMRDGIINRAAPGKPPRYAFLVRVGGKAKWHSGYPTIKAAKAARDETRAKVNSGAYIERTRLTLGEWLTEWEAAYNGEARATTRDSYGRVLRLYVHGHDIASVSLQKLTSADLVRHWSHVRENGRDHGDKPLSARTVRYAHTIVVKALNQAVEDRLLPHNPATTVGRKLPKADSDRRKDAWSPDALRAFLDARAEDRWLPLWALMANTGIRRGEALALRWQDVDLTAGTVLVDRAVSDTGRGATYGPTKTGKPRTVPLNAGAQAALRTWRAQQAAERLAAGPVWMTDAAAGELVFTWEDGRRVAGSYASKAFASAVRAAGAPSLTLHGLRHTFATNLLRAGVPVHTVSRLLGHSSPKMTLDVYAHVIPGDDSAATDALDRALNGS